MIIDLRQGSLGAYVGIPSDSPDTRICSHCGSRITEGFVYDEETAVYCSETCLYQHFTPEEWAEYEERANDIESYETGLAYYQVWKKKEE